MKLTQGLLAALLVLLALIFGGLAAGTFASLTDHAPLWLKTLGSLENAIGARLGTLGLPPFVRAVVLSVVTSALMGLAAYYKPRQG